MLGIWVWYREDRGIGDDRSEIVVAIPIAFIFA